MSLANLSLFLDVFILLGLVTTIYFSLRLNKSLNNFRKQRKDFEKIMRHLNENIERAHLSLIQLKGFSGNFDKDIQESLHEAKDLLDELKVMNQSGNNLADRLEHLASQSSYIKQANREMGSVRDIRKAREEDDEDFDRQLYNTISAMEHQSREYDDEGFSIQDPDFAAPVKPQAGTGGFRNTGRSKAEEELLQALKRHKKGA